MFIIYIYINRLWNVNGRNVTFTKLIRRNVTKLLRRNVTKLLRRNVTK